MTEDPHEPPSRRGALLALLLVLALAAGGWFLAQKLRAEARLQDCVASGRHDCVPIGRP